MYRVGQKEVDAVAEVLTSGKVFRYGIGGQCDRFEKRYGEYLGSKYVHMTASGTNALTGALIGAGIGPGDEVLVPACTYMATAIAVLAAGAIPVIVDIDDSITISPAVIEANVTPQTRAVIPVHMWGLPCDMKSIMRIARKHKLTVIEDACQAVGGGYEGKMLGAIGHVGAFSFNYFKNMTAGEGGAIVTNSKKVYDRVRCVIDCCGFYWHGRDAWFEHFVMNGARASEIEGALLNAQLDRIEPMIKAMRKQKLKILEKTAGSGLQPIRANSLEYECGTHVMYTLPTAEQAAAFAGIVGGTVTAKTGRHVYTEWDPIFAHQGAHHPALNPFHLKENKQCRMTYTKDMCAASLDILNRTVMLGTHPDRKAADVNAIIKRINAAAKQVLSN